MSKPMLSVDGLIAHMQNKGIRFQIMSETVAKEYLRKNNNYFKLTSYRKNYPTYTTADNVDAYVDLDFAYLVELARIDVELRHTILALCLDIEHFLKVSLMRAIEEDAGQDGYSIVLDYIFDSDNMSIAERANNASYRSNAISKTLERNRKNPYCGGLISNYSEEMPVWVFVEIISFGELLRFVQFVSNKIGWPLPVDIQTLDRVRQIRNAAAHNNCILNDLNVVKNPDTGRLLSSEPKHITTFVRSAGVSRDAARKKLSNRRVSQMVHLLYAFDQIVESENSRNRRLEELDSLLNNRMKLHANYFATNQLLLSTLSFFTKLSTICFFGLDIVLATVYNMSTRKNSLTVLCGPW